MNFKDYKENVKRTLPNLGDWFGNLIILDSLHCSLGCFSEYYELTEAIQKEDKVNVGEELTDKLWYATNYCNVRSIQIDVPIEFKVNDNSGFNIPKSALLERINGKLRYFCESMSELQDYDKKEWAYKKEETNIIKIQRAYIINKVLECLVDLYHLNSLNIEQCMQNNIDKLRARFPNSFNEQDANNRDLAKERIELEK